AGGAARPSPAPHDAKAAMTAWEPNPYSWALLASALVSAAIGAYAWTRAGGLARRLALAMAAVTVWTAAYGIALGVHELEPRIFWAKVQHLGIAYIPPNLLAFACAYVDREDLLAGGRRLALAIPPLLDVLLAATNELHGLIWRSIELVPSTGAATLRITYGPYFWLYTAYSYVVLLLGLGLLARAALRSGPLQRGQSRIMALGALFPWLGNLLYLSGASPFGRLDLTPFGYTLTGAALAWGLFRYRLLNVVPIARDRVVESMHDGFIVLDRANLLLDLNPPAEAILGAGAAATLIGKPLSSLPPVWGELVALAQAPAGGQREIIVSRPGGSRAYEVRLSPLDRNPLGGGERLGKLVMLQDITDRKHARDVRAAVAQREMQLARSIQLSLLPQEPPRPPGLDVAALSIPTSEVGGDLFAFHELPATDQAPAGYGFALGDVSGKGVPAALQMAVAMTLLAAKAPLATDAARLLVELNGALRPQMAPTHMNLALCYARLWPRAGGCRAQIASAGMVAPLLRRGGACSLLDVAGLPLGILPNAPDYRAIDLDLLPGDLLILYSDGVVEARDPAGELYGFERLLDCVERAPASNADQLLQWILADVYGFMGRASQHDDLTLMVIQLDRPSSA
ncbi:MAG TPA: histidine kinase N-terminal 7TM domain-containing protein, partial [Herpetosiphonaceae bacterium]